MRRLGSRIHTQTKNNPTTSSHPFHLMEGGATEEEQAAHTEEASNPNQNATLGLNPKASKKFTISSLNAPPRGWLTFFWVREEEGGDQNEERGGSNEKEEIALRKS